MKLTYFVGPYDLLNHKTLRPTPMTIEGMSVCCIVYFYCCCICCAVSFYFTLSCNVDVTDRFWSKDVCGTSAM